MKAVLALDFFLFFLQCYPDFIAISAMIYTCSYIISGTTEPLSFQHVLQEYPMPKPCSRYIDTEYRFINTGNSAPVTDLAGLETATIVRICLFVGWIRYPQGYTGCIVTIVFSTYMNY